MQLGWLILCQMDLAKGCSGGQQNAICGCAHESVSRTNEHWNQSLSKEGSSPQYGWASFNWLRTQREQSRRKVDSLSSIHPNIHLLLPLDIGSPGSHDLGT